MVPFSGYAVYAILVSMIIDVLGNVVGIWLMAAQNTYIGYPERRNTVIQSLMT